jgi:hypothetical protein
MPEVLKRLRDPVRQEVTPSEELERTTRELDARMGTVTADG